MCLKVRASTSSKKFEIHKFQPIILQLLWVHKIPWPFEHIGRPFKGVFSKNKPNIKRNVEFDFGKWKEFFPFLVQVANQPHQKPTASSSWRKPRLQTMTHNNNPHQPDPNPANLLIHLLIFPKSKMQMDIDLLYIT